MQTTVLLVDDDPEFLSTLSLLLTEAGYAVLLAKDASDMKVVLAAHGAAIGAAIIDLDLPEIGGLQIIAELAKAQGALIPTVAISGAYSDLYLEVAGYLGARISVRKPKDGHPLTPILDALNTLMN